MARVKHTVFVTAGAVELRSEIGRMLGVDLPGTLIFDYPTISAMSAMLAAKLAPEEVAVLLKPHVRYGYLMRLLLLPHGIASSAATIRKYRHQISSVVISMVLHLDSVCSDCNSQRAAKMALYKVCRPSVAGCKLRICSICCAPGLT